MLHFMSNILLFVVKNVSGCIGDTSISIYKTKVEQVHSIQGKGGDIKIQMNCIPHTHELSNKVYIIILFNPTRFFKADNF